MPLVPIITAGGTFSHLSDEGPVPLEYELEVFAFAATPTQVARLSVYISTDFMRQYRNEKTRAGAIKDYVMANAAWLFTYAKREIK